jgi:hypothetical protein
MKRFLILVFIGSTVLFIAIICLRIATRKQISQGGISLHQIKTMQQMVASFAEVKTQPLGSQDFNNAARISVETNLGLLTEDQRQKLFVCITRYYQCYSSGKFEDYKSFRLGRPYTLRKEVDAYFKSIATSKGIELKSNEDVLRFGWDYKNGNNTIGQVDIKSITLSIKAKSNIDAGLRLPSVVSQWPEQAVASCWESVILYKPSAIELLNQNGKLQFFTLNLFVRFTPIVDGPATPLVLVGYWDPTQNDWMPYALCTMLSVGSYETMF